MASKYEISAVFKLIDKITTPLDQVGIKGKSVGKALKRDFMAAQDSLDKFGKNLKKIGGYAIGASIAAAGAGIAVATKQFIEFDSAATAATAKFKDLDVTSETYAKSLKEVGQTARDVAAITEFNAVDTAGALDKMAMAGLTSVQSMKLLKGTTDLATAAGMDLTTAVDIATDSLGAFGLMTEDASQLQTNLNRVSDVMAKTTNMFNTDMPLMFESIKKGGPAFASAGQSMESFSTLIGVMASSGVKGSEAGTQLRNMMLSLANPSDAADKALKRLGVTVKDQNGNFLDIIDIISQFETGTKNMGSAEKAAALATIFGTRTVTGMNIVLQEGTDKLRAYRTDLENAGGSASNIAEAMRGSIKNKIEILKSALTELGFKFVESFQEKGVGLIEKLTDAITKFDPQTVIDAVVTAGNAIGGIIKIVWQLRHFILGVAIAWGIYKSAMIAAVVVGKIMGMVKAVQTLMAAQKGMNVVQAIFNALLNANPIGLFITAIGILIGLIIACEGKIQRLIGIFQILGMVLAVVFTPALAAISPLLAPIIFFMGFIYSILHEIISSWGMLVETFKSEGIIAGLKKLGGVLLSGILSPVQGLLELLAKIPGVGKFLGPAADQIAQFRNQLKGIEIETKVTADSVPVEHKTLASLNNPIAFSGTIPPKFAAPSAPVNMAPETAARAVNQPVFLQLQNPAPVNAAPPQITAPPAPHIAGPASVPVQYEFPALIVPPELIHPATVAVQWSVPEITEAASIPAEFDIGDYDIPPAPVNAAPPQITAPSAPRIAGPASVPVQYEFPALIVPPELIHPATVMAQWSVPDITEPPWENAFRRPRASRKNPAALPRSFPRQAGNISAMGPLRWPVGRGAGPAATETVSGRITRPVPAQTRRLVPPAVTNNDPARVDRIVPPAARTPISGTTVEAMTSRAPPMTRAEQMTAEQIINSRTEHKETVNVKIALDKGLQARVVNPPKSPKVKLEISGDA
jgi:TP901 family phage tail tape measure protein